MLKNERRSTSGILILLGCCLVFCAFDANAAPVIPEAPSENIKIETELRHFQPPSETSAFPQPVSDTRVSICGVEDDAEPRKDGRTKRYVLWGVQWNRNDLTYGVAKYSKKLKPEVVDGVLEEAFAIWAEHTNLNFTKTSSNKVLPLVEIGGTSLDYRTILLKNGEYVSILGNKKSSCPSFTFLYVTDINFTSIECDLAARAIIKISFVTGNHGDAYVFDGPGKPGVGNKLAHGFYPQESPLGGDIHFDDDENWSVGSSVDGNSVDLLQVAVHEIGHALGVKHSEAVGSIMNKYHNHQMTVVRLSDDDIAGIQKLYGKRRKNSRKFSELGKWGEFLGIMSNRGDECDDDYQ